MVLSRQPAARDLAAHTEGKRMRKFGVELEMIGPDGQRPGTLAVSIINRLGFEATENSHFGRTYTMWQAKPDSSLQPQHRATEVVSRIMPADRSSYDEITRIVSALDDAGFGVNRTCGFHVHINVADLSMRERQLVILRYAQIQADIDAMVPASRRGNSYCPALSGLQKRELCKLIEGERNAFYPEGHFSVTNMSHMLENAGSSARIEFRQAAATCNADKVVSWVSFLQEMIDEVVRRARVPGLQFGSAPVVVAPSPVLTPQIVGGRVPNMRPTSSAGRVLAHLCATGVITTAWAAENGIAENVLRRIIVGFRRHGAGIITTRSETGPVYTLSGVTELPVTAERVFAQTVLPAPTPVPPAAPQSAVTRAHEFVAYPFEEGLSVPVRAWCRSRRDTFAASRDPS